MGNQLYGDYKAAIELLVTLMEKALENGVNDHVRFVNMLEALEKQGVPLVHRYNGNMATATKSQFSDELWLQESKGGGTDEMPTQ